MSGHSLDIYLDGTERYQSSLSYSHVLFFSTCPIHFHVSDPW